MPKTLIRGQGICQVTNLKHTPGSVWLHSLATFTPNGTTNQHFMYSPFLFQALPQPLFMWASPRSPSYRVVFHKNNPIGKRGYLGHESHAQIARVGIHRLSWKQASIQFHPVVADSTVIPPIPHDHVKALV